MTRGRLEAFSDGVMAIIITIMVLEIKTPHGNDFSALKPIVSHLISYVLSFIYIGIYWNNHHHMLHATEQINGRVLLTNLFLLFWLSLIPFSTAWAGESHFSSASMAVYGIILFMAAIAYNILQNSIIAINGKNSVLAKSVDKDIKGKLSIILYAAAIAASFICEWIAAAIYVFVAIMWIIPDKRIEKRLKSDNKEL